LIFNNFIIVQNFNDNLTIFTKREQHHISRGIQYIYVFYNLCMQLTRKLFEIVIYIIIYHRHPKYNNNSIYIYFELRFNLRKLTDFEHVNYCEDMRV
jgi:hypothetical protein